MERKKASDYPQELLDLFHEYQHGAIDRRTFLDRAARFAVGGLTAAAILDSLSPNYAWAQQVAKDDARIKTRRLIDAGVSCELHVYPGAIHAFEMVPETRLAAQAASDLKRGLTRLFG